MLQSDYPTEKGVLSISRKSYMAELRNLLSFMKEKDRERALTRYEELFDQVGRDREDALVAALGSALRQVLALEREYTRAQKEGADPFREPMTLPEGFAPAPPSADHSETETEAAEESFVRAAAVVLEEDDRAAEAAWEAISTMDEGFPLEELIPPGEPPLRTDETVFPEVLFGLPAEEAPAPAEEESAPGEEPDSDASPAPEAPEEPPLPAETPAEPESEPGPEAEQPSDPAAETEESPAKEEPAVSPAPARSKVSKGSTSPGTGRVMAAILVTFPFLLLWIAGFVVFVALGLAVMALGFGVGVAGVYFTTYVTGGRLGFMPDILLVAGIALGCFALALLLLWTGFWIAVGGFASILHWTGTIYRKILHKRVPRKGGDQ